MKAIEVPRAITLLNVQTLDGQTVLETTCSDYEHYKSLPQVVSYNGVMCGLTGWNSDLNKACYKSGIDIAQGI
jgi:hypothetical protein